MFNKTVLLGGNWNPFTFSRQGEKEQGPPYSVGYKVQLCFTQDR